MPDALTSPTTDRHAIDAPVKPGPAAWLRQRRNAATGAVGVVVGIAPHVLHHVGVLGVLGVLGGTALVAGSGGTALFGALGLVLSLPMLFRLRRRFGNWTAPAVGLAVFIVMFALSTWVIGPAISGSSDVDSPVPTIDHSSHH